MPGKVMVIAGFVLAITSCGDNGDPCEQVSYSADVIPIIETNCAITDCHVGSFIPGDFTSYEVLKEKVVSGKFDLMVLDLKIMPPGDSLTTDELATLRCWTDNGAPQN